MSLGSLLCSLGMSLDGSGIFLDLCLSSLLGSLAGGIGVRSHLGSIGIDGSLGGGSTLLNACGQVGDAVDQISNGHVALGSGGESLLVLVYIFFDL